MDTFAIHVMYILEVYRQIFSANIKMILQQIHFHQLKRHEIPEVTVQYFNLISLHLSFLLEIDSHHFQSYVA